MRRSANLLTALLFLAALAVPAATQAREDRLTRDFPFAPGERLELRTDVGHIDVRTGRADGVTLTVIVDDASLEEALDIQFDTAGGGLRVVARKQPGARSRGGWLSGWFGDRDSLSVRFEIDAPERMDLNLETQGGHINLDDLDGDADIQTSGGHIRFGDVSGRVQAGTAGGHIQGEHVGGGGEARTAGGHIEIRSAGGDLRAQTAGGHIDIGRVDGNLEARTAGGHIESREVAGDMSLTTAGGHIESRGCAGRAEVRTAGGRIELEEMAGPVQARTSGGDVRIELATGQSGAVEVEIDGDGDLYLAVPAGAGYQLLAQGSRRGRVETDPALQFDGSRSGRRVEGSLNGGGDELRLRVAQGDIRISRR